MLSYRTNATCGCCGTPYQPRVYRWLSFTYCITCLHSIGRNAAGNFCTARQVEEAWHRLAHGDDSDYRSDHRA